MQRFSILSSKHNYMKGYRAEKKAREFLEGQGYYVLESRGSHGAFDLVAVPLRAVSKATDGLVRLVQVKSGERPRPADRGKVRSMAAKFEAGRVLCELWWFPDYQTQPLIEVVS